MYLDMNIEISGLYISSFYSIIHNIKTE